MIENQKQQMNYFQVAVAAEAYTGAILAQASCDVSIQYGANQPEYDLIATKNNSFRKISVKVVRTEDGFLLPGLRKGVTILKPLTLG